MGGAESAHKEEETMLRLAAQVHGTSRDNPGEQPSAAQAECEADLVAAAAKMAQPIASIEAYAVVAPLLTLQDTPSGVALLQPPVSPSARAATEAFRDAATHKCWGLRANHKGLMLLCHAGAGWRLVRQVTEDDIRDAYLVMSEVAPSEQLRESVPWRSVPDYEQALELLQRPAMAPVPSLLVPIIVSSFLEAGGEIMEVPTPLSPVRRKGP